MTTKKKYYKISEAAAMLGIAPDTLRKHTRAGKVECDYSPSGQRIYTLEQLSEYDPKIVVRDEDHITAFYLRSSDGSQDLINYQLKNLEDSFGKSDYTLMDKASGLNENRRGLKKLIKLAKQGKITRVCVTEKDRLTRFGFSFLEELLNDHRVEIVVLNKSSDKSPQEELLSDFMSLLASFSGKFYRLRRKGNNKKFFDEVGAKITDA